MNNNPIGVFDSGIGGLTVVKEIIRKLPNESLIYLGDTARVPYGTRGKEVNCQILVTDAPERVTRVAKIMFGSNLPGEIQKVSLT